MKLLGGFAEFGEPCRLGLRPGGAGRAPLAARSPEKSSQRREQGGYAISPAAQKFHLFILCSTLDNSVTVSDSSAPGLMLGKRHMADANQNIAEPHAAIITAI